MGVKVEVLYTKDTPFDEMIPKIAQAYKELGKDEEGYKIPVPFLERITETRALSVIQHAVDELFKAIDFSWFTRGDIRQMHRLVQLNVLDEVYIIAHEMCAEPDRNLDTEGRVKHREKAQELQDWLNKRTPAKNSVQDLNAMTDIIEGPDTSESFARFEKNAYVRPIVVRAGEGSEKSDNYIACMAMLRAALMAPSEVISDLPRVMKTLKGRCHPMDGFFIQMYDGAQITNWMQLSKWIDEKGLMPL